LAQRVIQKLIKIKQFSIFLCNASTKSVDWSAGRSSLADVAYFATETALFIFQVEQSERLFRVPKTDAQATETDLAPVNTF
jgi:hypothetical protein